jgi:hypothetical protein
MEKYMGHEEIEAGPALSYQFDLSANRRSELTPFSSYRAIFSSFIKLSHLDSVPIDCLSRCDRPFTFCCIIFHSYRDLQHNFEAVAAEARGHILSLVMSVPVSWVSRAYRIRYLANHHTQYLALDDFQHIPILFKMSQMINSVVWFYLHFIIHQPVHSL